MNNKLTTLNFENTEVRKVIDPTGEVWFVARDVATILGYKNISDSISRHCKGDPIYRNIMTNSGIQKMRVITEAEVNILKVKCNITKIKPKQYIYVIKSHNNLIKIGITSNLHKRITALKNMNACKLELIYKTVGSNSLERSIHKKFEKYRSHGEWFKSYNGILEDIKIHCSKHKSA